MEEMSASTTTQRVVCKYCNEPENKQDRPGLTCDTCKLFIHLNCLKRESTPGDFACDVFFDFTCAECSPSSQEVFLRNKMPWINCLLLTLNHLNTYMQGISNHGFFHYKMHICCFVDRYWVQLFGSNFKQKKNWIGTIAGALSVYNNLFFRSGSVVLGESGWWQLQHNFSPAVAAQIIQELELRRPKGKPVALDKSLFVAKLTEMGYKEYLNTSPEVPLYTDDVPHKKRRLDAEDDIKKESLDDSFERELKMNLTCVTAKDNFTDMESMFAGFHYTQNNKYIAPSESSSMSNKFIYDSDSHSSHNHTDEEKSKKSEVKIKKIEDKPVFRSQSLFSTLPNSTDMPWVEKEEIQDKSNLVAMTEYEEVQLLKNVENLLTKVKDPNKKAELYRLRAKLALRRLKRHQHLPIFDLDKTVKLLGGYVTEDSRVVMNAERILDRFQRSYLIDNLCGTISSTNYGTLLLSHIEPTAFRSPYSGTILKPYIRRDATSAPTWLKLSDELFRRTHRDIKDYEPPPRATIDYSYVRPQHIAAINNLCAQFFWPGIDVTEALQYPEFSCVVTYKRLVIAFAFLVPDVGHNEAYISFVLTRPEWRNARVASFMLYHLLQTCTDKDVTLHVSPTNPAIFLYQKFGFKVEELIQDFYEKYFDIDYKGCRHALFLRLSEPYFLQAAIHYGVQNKKQYLFGKEGQMAGLKPQSTFALIYQLIAIQFLE